MRWNGYHNRGTVVSLTSHEEKDRPHPARKSQDLTTAIGFNDPPTVTSQDHMRELWTEAYSPHLAKDLGS